MVVNGEVIGYQIFQSGACQLFVMTGAKDNDRVLSAGRIIYPIWQGKGTYDFKHYPSLIGASVRAFVGRNESGIIEITPRKGGES